MSYLLNKFDCGFQVESKVDEVPLDTLFPVLLLFKSEHVMVEELLDLLVCQVDTQLFERVELKQGV